MGVFAGLCSLACISLFLAHFLQRSSALMPLVSVSLSMVWFTLAGVLGLLPVAAWLWYGLAAVGLLAVIIVKKKKIIDLFSPGLALFLVGSAAFILLFWATQPMLTHWDEFTFWGIAGKVVGQSGQLYTTAHSNLIATSYPPGLIVYTYMMQFFGGYNEPGFLACFAVLYLACFAAATALWDKHKTAAVVCMAGLFFLPFFFSVNWPAGQFQWQYALCMADLPLSLLFGGAICFYYTGGEKGGRLLLPFGVILAALVCVKDMGLALALVALAMAVLDMLFCERERMAFLRLRRWKALFAAVLYALVMVVGMYLLWAWHLKTMGTNRFDLGSAGVRLTMAQMLLSGVQMLFGVGRTEQFSIVLDEMLRAFIWRPVSLIGSGVAVFGVLLVLAVMLWVLSATKRQRRRVLVFTLGMTLGFVAFYVFNIFTYGLIFKYQEAVVLKDYHRYIAPYWVGWMMGTLALLSRTATNPRATFYRLRVARLASAAASLCLVVAVLLLGNWNGNFLRISPSFYGTRKSVQTVVQVAEDEGMKAEDIVYIISQGDDGTRFYMFGYEMPAERSLLYFGYWYNLSGQLMKDEADQPILYGNVAVTLVPEGAAGDSPALYAMEGTVEEVLKFMRLQKCTHVLVDVPDAYILEAFGPLFADRLDGWDPETTCATGRRYYRIEWDDKGGAQFVPAVFAPADASKGGAAA